MSEPLEGYAVAVPVNDEGPPEQTVVVHSVGDGGNTSSDTSTRTSFWSRLFGARGASNVTPRPQRDLPLQYSDCIGYDEKVAWINSERGLKILDQRPVLKEYYKSGRLLRMIQNRHWDIRLNEWLHIDDETTTQPVPLGLAFDTPKELKPRPKSDLDNIHHDNPPIPVMFKDHPNFLKPMIFPTSAKYDILTDGYTVFRGIIPPDVVDNAVAAIGKMVAESEAFSQPLADRIKNPRSGDPFFTSGGSNDKAVLALYYCSPIYALVESLLHNEIVSADNKTPFHARAGGAQIAFRFSQARPLGAWERKIGGRSWHLDGMDRGTYGPFSLLIGVALSDQSLGNCGNLAVHPGSHHTLKPFLKQYSAACDHTGIDPLNTQLITERRMLAVALVQQKPILDEPVEVKLNKGDVVFALHKVAHLGTPNYSDGIRKQVYFRVSHKNLDKIRHAALEDIWIEYEGMSEVLY